MNNQQQEKWFNRPSWSTCGNYDKWNFSDALQYFTADFSVDRMNWWRNKTTSWFAIDVARRCTRRHRHCCRCESLCRVHAFASWSTDRYHHCRPITHCEGALLSGVRELALAMLSLQFFLQFSSDARRKCKYRQTRRAKRVNLRRWFSMWTLDFQLRHADENLLNASSFRNDHSSRKYNMLGFAKAYIIAVWSSSWMRLLECRTRALKRRIFERSDRSDLTLHSQNHSRSFHFHARPNDSPVRGKHLRDNDWTRMSSFDWRVKLPNVNPFAPKKELNVASFSFLLFTVLYLLGKN